jgi:urease accessory protein
MFTPVVLAHVFAGDAGPGAGFIHPLTGVDHLLAMFCIGVLSARIGGRAIWMVPGAFVSVMLVGGICGMRGLGLPAPEIGIAVSVLGLGALLALGDRTPTQVACVAAGLFGLYHGFAHGREMPLAISPALYAVGFLVSTAGLHVAGALTGALTMCRPGGALRLRVAGAIVSVIGMFFAARALGLSTLARRALP